jgi:hypothetical protein
MENKYYTPKIEEFHVGFEFQFNDTEENIIFTENCPYPLEIITDFISRKLIRVKYLDREDVESLGFIDKPISANQKFSYYKILEDDKVYQITEFWSMNRSKRENLIRVFVGSLYKYPYTEIFRGDIKNKSELKRLMQQLNINTNGKRR